jgi:hypothetical protein
MSDSQVIIAPPGTLNSNAAMAYSGSHPQNQVTAGSLLVTVSGTQQTLAQWLGTVKARNSASLQIQWVTGAVVTADTVYFAYVAPYAGTINSMTYFCNTGSYTVAVQINGTPVTGLGAINNNSGTPATTAATGANTFAAGAIIEGVITSPSGSPTDTLMSLSVTWS